MKKVIITLSKVFPAGHIHAGQETNFIPRLRFQLTGKHCKQFKCNYCEVFPKLHTIRTNYDFWAGKLQEVIDGTAVLYPSTWTGKPYASKQQKECSLTGGQIGYQELIFENGNIGYPIINGTRVSLQFLANNDGLTIEQFKSWFKGYDLTRKLIIIHFTKFRY